MKLPFVREMDCLKDADLAHAGHFSGGGNPQEMLVGVVTGIEQPFHLKHFGEKFAAQKIDLEPGEFPLRHAPLVIDLDEYHCGEIRFRGQLIRQESCVA